MNLQSLFLVKASSFALSVCRIGGFVAVSPFPGNNIPTTQRIGLVVVLAFVVGASAPTTARVPKDIGAELFMSAAGEIGCGLVIGFTFLLVFSAAEVLGQIVSQAVGLGMPSVLNPAIETHDAVIGRILTLMAMLIAFGVGAHRVAISYLLASFHAIPIGTPLEVASAMPAMVTLAGDSIAIGLQLAMPVVAVNFVAQAALALLARAAPSLQVFNVGMSILVAAGIVVLVAALDGVGSGLVSVFMGMASNLDRMLTTIAENGQ